MMSKQNQNMFKCLSSQYEVDNSKMNNTGNKSFNKGLNKDKDAFPALLATFKRDEGNNNNKLTFVDKMRLKEKEEEEEKKRKEKDEEKEEQILPGFVKITIQKNSGKFVYTHSKSTPFLKNNKNNINNENKYAADAFKALAVLYETRKATYIEMWGIDTYQKVFGFPNKNPNDNIDYSSSDEESFMSEEEY